MTKKETAIRFCRFLSDGHTYSGVIRGNSVDIVEGDPFEGIISQIRLSFPIERVKFLPPFEPKQLWCIGRNYAEHARELEHDIPKEPLVFIKANSSIIGADDFIRIPSWAAPVHYEGELVVVIGKGGRNITEEEAYDHVIGYTIMNDISARGLQYKDGQWARSKSFDTFAPFGPAVLLAKELPQETRIVTRLNGKTVQDGTISQMLFPIPRLIAHISRFATLRPGDIISTGTPKGVGEIKPGDLIEVEIEPIGMLRNICSE